MWYTLAEAVKATGWSKSTIIGTIEAGQITATKDLFGEWQIERGELHRLYSLVSTGNPGDDAAPQYPAPSAATLEADMEALLSAAGDGLRQPSDHPRRDPDVIGAEPQAAQYPCAGPNHTDLWAATPPTSDASEAIAPPSVAPERFEFSVSAGRDRLSWQPGAEDKSPAIDQIGGPAPEPGPARDPTCDDEIRVGNQDRVPRQATPFVAQRTCAALIAILLVAALGLGWIGGWSRTDSTSPKQKLDASARSPQQETVRIDPSDPSRAAQNTRKIATPATARPARGHDGPQGAAQPPSASTKPIPSPGQNAPASSRSPAVVQQEAKLEPKRIPTPETRPTTIEGWTIREVVGGTAVLQGPNGVWRAARGDTVPGVGRVDSIVRWGNRWIVATSRGLISTQ